MVGDVHDVITCAKFQIEIFKGYDFTGVDFSIFLFIFAWALQQCCSPNALPVIHMLNFAAVRSWLCYAVVTCMTGLIIGFADSDIDCEMIKPIRRQWIPVTTTSI